MRADSGSGQCPSTLKGSSAPAPRDGSVNGAHRMSKVGPGTGAQWTTVAAFRPSPHLSGLIQTRRLLPTAGSCGVRQPAVTTAAYFEKQPIPRRRQYITVEKSTSKYLARAALFQRIQCWDARDATSQLAESSRGPGRWQSPLTCPRPRHWPLQRAAWCECEAGRERRAAVAPRSGQPVRPRQRVPGDASGRRSKSAPAPRWVC